MITSEQIKKKALNLYVDALRAYLSNEPFFPKALRSDKMLSKDFITMQKELSLLLAESKDRRGYGYSVICETIRSRSHGNQDIPKAIVFETETDLMQFIGKKNEYERFRSDSSYILEKSPDLFPWMLKNPLEIVKNGGSWIELMKVCIFFTKSYPENHFYIRELPVSVHTKFIESNKGILKSLLDFLIPEKLDVNENVFEKRYRLKYPEPRIRVRFLDMKLYISGKFKDISLPLHEFKNAYFECDKIFITENKMNFLTLPPLSGAITIWGGGYAVKNLKDIHWLRDKKIYYWGDIDAHGFEILSQLRSYYPNAKSLMMDASTFKIFSDFQGKGTTLPLGLLSHLTSEEADFYQIVRKENIRLEQEKIPQWYVEERFSSINN